MFSLPKQARLVLACGFLMYWLAPGSAAAAGHKLLVHLGSLNCPSQSECIEVGLNNDNEEAADIFNPRAAADSDLLTFSPKLSQYTAGLACPTVSQCTTVDNGGDVVTFNPVKPNVTKISTISGSARGAAGIACPSVMQCSATSPVGEQATFDPRSPHPRFTPLVRNVELLWPVCTSRTLCIATELDTGRIATWDPRSGALRTVAQLASRSGIRAVACPSGTDCVVGTSTGVIAFDPRTPNGNRRALSLPRADSRGDASSVSGVSSLSCPSASICVGLLPNNRVFSFNPKNFAGHVEELRDVGGTLSDVSCGSTRMCAAITDGYSGPSREISFKPQL